MALKSFAILPQPAPWGVIVTAFEPLFESVGNRSGNGILNLSGNDRYDPSHVHEYLLNLHTQFHNTQANGALLFRTSSVTGTLLVRFRRAPYRQLRTAVIQAESGPDIHKGDHDGVREYSS